VNVEQGWIEHDGKGCPIESNTLCKVQYFNEPRENAERYRAKAASFRDWPWKNPRRATSARDIIAYRIVKQEPGK
jgi:hypothetical protein